MRHYPSKSSIFLQHPLWMKVQKVGVRLSILYISKSYTHTIKNSNTDEAKQKNATFAGLFFEI